MERTIIIKFKYYKAEKFPIKRDEVTKFESVVANHPRTLKDMEIELFNEIQDLDWEEFLKHIKIIQ